ncbi:MAG: glycosyl transferase, group 1 [Candidatus Moranbacteria bacterium GW2011_GWA2_39_41]|nr:MAG: glycosyl transferase, group 1 [Candidatus Moranbacteria bacterium GW2011_GWA2_39_41]
MRIGIDARFFGIKQKGLGRYTQKLVENLEKVSVGDGNEYLVFLKKENFEEYQPSNPNFKKVLADYQWYTFAEQVYFPWTLYRHNLNLVHFPHFNVPITYFKKFVVTIHDLTLLHFPTVRNSTLHPIFYRLKFLAYRMVIHLAIVRAKRIITISQFTKKDIIDNYGKAVEKKIFVTYESAEDHCMFSAKNAQEILQKYAIIKPYLIYVGNAYPHKNLERLVSSFAQVLEKNSQLQLVLVGKRDYFYDRLRKLIVERKIGNIVLLSDISDHILDLLFHQSLANVFPSLYEGFGLPPLEAMSKGVPVISSDHPCMREMLGESAYFFDGLSVDSIAQAMLRIISDEKLRKELIEKGFEQTKKYSWKRMAQETQLIYENILS